MSAETIADFTAAHTAWHAGVEAQRSSEYGPLSVTGLFWLDADPHELPGIPGRWSATADGTVMVSAAASDQLTFNGETVAGELTVGPFTGIESTFFEWGNLRIQVAARSGKIAVRPLDPASPDRANYTGTNTFPADPAWVVTGRYQSLPRESVEVDTAVDWGKQYYDSPGRAIFEIDGQQLSLTLFGNEGSSDLRVNFADATGVDLTYPAVRFVEATRIDEDTVVIDFNRAINPPCANSASATCPYAPPENRLPVRIEAGELRPGVSL